MRPSWVAVVAVGLVVSAGRVSAHEPEEHGTAVAEPAPWEEDEANHVRGFLGGLLGVGVGLNGQLDVGLDPYVDTSLLFAARGGLLLGDRNRWMLGFEVAPATNRLDWRKEPTATGFVSFGKLIPVRGSREWSWLPKVGFGVGGGLDYRLLVAVQLDVLTFNYKMNDRLWVDFGIPTMRFHIETSEQARFNAQFVFPLGITFVL